MDNEFDGLNKKNKNYRFFGLSFLVSFILVGYGILSIILMERGTSSISGSNQKTRSMEKLQYIMIE